MSLLFRVIGVGFLLFGTNVLFEFDGRISTLLFSQKVGLYILTAILPSLFFFMLAYFSAKGEKKRDDAWVADIRASHATIQQNTLEAKKMADEMRHARLQREQARGGRAPAGSTGQGRKSVACPSCGNHTMLWPKQTILCEYCHASIEYR
ncbi:hypothetical protein BBD42_14825 [Paenibacillus sp. BIHB 4019]|uniref:Uncharacterized protein n=1 Tax=Paenibacillus sp. BIHB 4019 TaxID=1870819 RepID=A0A1B2DIR5_9BACL|nr:hypothetical protein [Paenibacillus sp. BIHB 4019]ANY67608.1 hypothetical protein BBD42_14825 [Paenibacillus sp. BIHB 4019]